MAYKDKEDRKRYSKNHYAKNKASYKKRAYDFNKQTRSKTRQFVNDYLSEHPCVDCGESDVIVLEFDHVKGEKKIEIANAIKSNWSLEKIKVEIAKCDVRCANCHRRVTYKRRQDQKNSKVANKKNAVVQTLLPL